MEQEALIPGLPEKPKLRRGPGRPKGSVDRHSHAVKMEASELALRIIQDEEYRAGLLMRARRGQLHGSVETMLWYYAFGKPVETVDVHGEISVLLQKFKQLEKMSDDELDAFLGEVESYVNDHD